MSNQFISKIIKGKIKSPTRADFNLEKWNEGWTKVELNSSARDKKVYTMGIIIYSVLKDIREALADLYRRAPKTNYEKLMISYIASSNRTSAVALKLAKKTTTTNVNGILLEANKLGNKQSLGEIVHGAVDGFQFAIRECLRGIEKNSQIIISTNPIDELSFIQQESWLSQLYNTYIHLWQCVLWSDYNLVEVESEHKTFKIEQPNTPFEIAFNNSSQRKERLSVQRTLIASQPDIAQYFDSDKYIFITRENKKRVAKVASIRNAKKELITINAQWRVEEKHLEDYFPKEWLRYDFGKGFCLLEVLNVMRVLMLIANIETEKYPEDDSVFNVNKLREFCPTVQTSSLERALCEATEMSVVKVTKILDFLTFNSSPTGDIWCQPLIKLKKNKYALLTSALNAPVMFRLIERWACHFNINLAGKGTTYETKVVDKINRVLGTNTFITDYDKAVSKRIKINSIEEEIDLLSRIDDMILIGEAKSIVTTDSEISKYRTSEILQHAGEQVVRKTEFIKNNIEVVFERLGWSYDKNKNYNFAGFIINSSQIFVGYSFNSIPVIDEKILLAYFASNEINLLTVISQNGFNPIAWHRLYNNIDELKGNFKKYIANPPQLHANTKRYEYNEIKFPHINSESYKISKKYLVFKPGALLAPMEQEHSFPVIKSVDYDSEVMTINMSL
ncbi:hypothetical protein HZ61_001540 [Escherichia coli]|uniref:hypothetical protein n=1 Tax=Escherichia coli TaxID=562 RepID=UPI001839F03D|nr:hypothetical protein [Escherichia coli]HCN7961364.1 hypothetical protein [Escherichia coli]HCN9032034.1 hypothetical protein [Escherichia coli]